MTARDVESTATYRARGSAEVGFSTDRTALLVIDPVNDFLSEGGAAWDLTKSTVRLHNVIPNLRRLIEGARAHDIPILFGPMAYTEDDYADHELYRRSGINRIMFERRMFLAGSWGADFHPDLRPQDGDVVLMPHKGTDVFETDLPGHLESMGITHLVIAGMTANLCCEGTGRHASEAGYDVTFISDAIGSESLPSYQASIRLNFPLIGNAVMKVDEFLQALDELGETPKAVQEGDTVRGSDHLEIGTVKKVSMATETNQAYLLVPRGMVVKRDTYIPLDAVVRRVGSDVFINVPRLVVGKMGWSTPPTRDERAEKLGPQKGKVERLYGSRSPSSAEHRGHH